MTYVPQHRQRLVAAATAQAATAAERVRRPRRRRRWHGLSAPLLAALAIALVPAVVVAGTMILRPAKTADEHLPGQPHPPIGRHPAFEAGRPPAPELLRAFSVLRRPQRSGDAFGPGEDIGTSRYFSDQIRRIDALPPLHGAGRRVPGVIRVAGAPDDRVCVFVRHPPAYRGAYGPAGTCGTPDQAARGRVAFTSSMVLVGVVPDGVDRVRVTLLDGRVTVLRVTDNVFSVRLAYPARRFAFHGPGGPVLRRLLPNG
jgi:hypothetical protein